MSEENRNERGEVGTGTVSRNIKRLFRSVNTSLSLKEFARSLTANGNEEQKELASSWLSHKSPSYYEEAKELRRTNKGATIAAQKQATKNSRKRSKSDNKQTFVGGAVFPN
jgi:hypothetical protein